MATAQPVPQPLEISPSGDAYLQAIRRRGVQSGVGYFDPTAPAPALDTHEEPTTRTRDPGEWTIGNLSLPVKILTVLVLGFIFVLFLRYGGPSRLSLGPSVSNPARNRRSNGISAPPEATTTRDVNAILANPDKRAALIELSQLLLSRVVTANGLLLQRSWTARDVLRRLPQDQSYLSELSDLIMTGERVHFGEKPVSSEDLDSFATRATSLLRKLAP